MRDEQLGMTLEHLLGMGDGTTYDALRESAEGGLLARLRGLHLANRFTIRLWLRAPAADWSVLSSELDPEGTKVEVGQVDQLLGRLIAQFQEIDEATQVELPSMLDRAIKVRENAGKEPGADHPALGALEQQLEDPHEWASGQEMLDREERLYNAALALRALGRNAVGRVEELLLGNLVRGLQSPMGSLDSAEASVALEGSLRLAGSLSPGSLAQVAAAIQEFDPEVDEGAAASEVFARSGLAQLLRGQGVEATDPAFTVSRAKLVAVAGSGSRMRHAAIGSWIGLGGSVDEVWEVLKPLRGSSGAVDEALAAWGGLVTSNQRTALARRLLLQRTGRTGQLAAVACAGAINEKALSEAFKAALFEPGNDSDRRRLVRAAKAIGFTTQNSGQVLSDTACELLAKGRPKSDIGVAVELIATAPAKHLKPQLIGKALKEACKRHDYLLKGEEVRVVRGAGIAVTEKMVKKRFRDKIPKPKNPFKR